MSDLWRATWLAAIPAKRGEQSCSAFAIEAQAMIAIIA